MSYVASLNQIGGVQNQYNVYKNFGYNVPAYKNIKMPIAYNNSQPRLIAQPKTDWYGKELS